MHYKLLFPSTYLCAADLQGQDVHLTIRRVVVQELEGTGGEREKKPLVYFEETKAKADETGTKEKRLVLNVTNAKVIALMHGNEVADWSGKRITLYATTCESFGETVDCVRVRKSVPKTEND